MTGLYIPNRANFEAKIIQIKADGAEKLHIVSDFDRTLTGESGDKKAPTTSWSIFVKELGEVYATKRKELFDHFFPIERNDSLPFEYRSEQMSVWWRQHLDLLTEHKVTEQMIAKVLSEENLKLRGGVPELLELAHNLNIPFLIFSAGIGDAIRIHLKDKKCLFSNTHILSNFFEFNSDGLATGFKHEVVQTFNKTEALVRTKWYHEQIEHRPNCILLGDSLHDSTMTDGLPHKTVLKIGFLNSHQPDLATFEKVYDAIIIEDTNIKDVSNLLNEIVGS